ncbi:hypothetical protein [Stenotrophomonas sp. 57]|uniref:hypothetical protein n=1 Tax=Stenotrophomonas sp. 57 TaxID=3051119 RepID=UPI00256EB352|nr:hypothetical protein [Stenotrophomonas sp. 57]
MIRFISFEFVLKWMPNGGTAVLIRSWLITLWLYVLAISLKSRVEPGATWQFDLNTLRALVSDTIPWIGAIFAGVYVALYSRFASQWSYLANLYNQILQAAVQSPPQGISSEQVYRLWQAGFIEDAEELHLARKPMFASVIASMLVKHETRKKFVEHAPGGEARLTKLEGQIRGALESSIKKRGFKVSDLTMPTATTSAASSK